MNKELYKQIGDLSDSKDLVKANLKLVVHLAKKYQGMGIPLDDLISEGTIGLCKAAEMYNPTLGKFSSYAAAWIKALIRQSLNNTSRGIRIPTHKIGNKETHPVITELETAYRVSVQPAVEEDYSEDDISYKLNSIIDVLKPKQQEIIRMKFGIGEMERKTSDIAKELGLTVQAVNANIRNALKILKTKLN